MVSLSDASTSTKAPHKPIQPLKEQEHGKETRKAHEARRIKGRKEGLLMTSYPKGPFYVQQGSYANQPIGQLGMAELYPQPTAYEQFRRYQAAEKWHKTPHPYSLNMGKGT